MPLLLHRTGGAFITDAAYRTHSGCRYRALRLCSRPRKLQVRRRRSAAGRPHPDDARAARGAHHDDEPPRMPPGAGPFVVGSSFASRARPTPGLEMAVSPAWGGAPECAA